MDFTIVLFANKVHTTLRREPFKKRYVNFEVTLDKLDNLDSRTS